MSGAPDPGEGVKRMGSQGTFSLPKMGYNPTGSAYVPLSKNYYSADGSFVSNNPRVNPEYRPGVAADSDQYRAQSLHSTENVSDVMTTVDRLNAAYTKSGLQATQDLTNAKQDQVYYTGGATLYTNPAATKSSRDLTSNLSFRTIALADNAGIRLPSELQNGLRKELTFDEMNGILDQLDGGKATSATPTGDTAANTTNTQTSTLQRELPQVSNAKRRLYKPAVQRYALGNQLGDVSLLG